MGCIWANMGYSRVHAWPPYPPRSELAILFRTAAFICTKDTWELGELAVLECTPHNSLESGRELSENPLQTSEIDFKERISRDGQITG